MDKVQAEIDLKAQKALAELKSFRKQVQQLRGELMGLEEGTEEYNETLSKLANKQFQLREMNENVRYSVTDLGEQLATVTRIASGVVAGFSAVQGAVQLFGGDSENLQKTMVKLQAAMAFVQGLQGLEGLGKDLKRAQIQFSGAAKAVKGFITGLNGMKAAIAATGIGALVVAVGLLIANWEKITALFKDKTGIKTAEEAINDLNKAIDDNNKLLEKANTEVIYQYSEALSKAGNNADELRQILANYNKELKDNQEQLLKDNVALAEQARYKAEIARATLSASGYDEGDKKYVTALEAEKAAVVALEEAERKLAEFYLKDKIDAANAVIKASDDKAKADKAAAEKAKIEAENAEKTRNAELDEIKKFNREIEIANMSAEDAEIARLIDQLNEKKALYEKNGQDTAALVKYYDGLKQEVTDKYSKAAAEETKENLEKQLELIDGYIDALRNRVSGQLFNLDFSYDNSLAEEDAKMFDFTSEKTKLDNYKEYENQRLAIFSAGIEQENAMLETKMKTELANTELTESEKLRIKQQYDAQIIENNKLVEQETIASGNRVAKAQTETARKTTQSAVQTATAALSAASSIMGALQDGIDTTTKEGFEKNKKIQIANATIGMLTGVVNAIAGLFTTKSGPWDIALAAIQAATIAATGGIQIANIKKQTFDGGSETPSTPNVASMALPTQVYGTQLSDMNEINLQQMQTNTRVYVVESDIADTQNAIKTQVDESTF